MPLGLWAEEAVKYREQPRSRACLVQAEECEPVLITAVNSPASHGQVSAGSREEPVPLLTSGVQQITL